VAFGGRFGHALLVLLCLAANAAAQGVEARSPHFRVMTTLPPEAAQAAAAAMERYRTLLGSLGFAVPPGLTDVVLFPDLAEMQSFGQGGAIGFYRPGADATFLCVAWKEADDPLRALAHEFAHHVTRALVAGHPWWLREGIADLLSNMEAAPAGWKLGAPIAGHVEVLRREPWLDWKQVSAAGRHAANPVLYAQAWLLAHRLIVGRSAAGSLARRIESLEVPPAPLVTLPDPLPVEVLAAAAPVAVPEPRLRTAEPWEYEHRLAELLRALNRGVAARQALDGLRARFPQRPEPAESLGALAMDSLDYPEAEERLGEAVRLGSANATTYYRYSLLLMQPGKSAQEAARHASRAVELDPLQPLHWLARGQAEMLLARWDQARASLVQMQNRSSDPLLVEQARVELAEIGRRQEQALRPPRGPEPPPQMVVTRIPEPAPEPPSVSPPPRPRPARRSETHPGTLRFWGFLRRVDCSEDGKILTVVAHRFTVRVREPASRPARLYSPPAGIRRIPCTLKDVEVNVVYRPASQFGGINGDLVAVIF